MDDEAIDVSRDVERVLQAASEWVVLRQNDPSRRTRV